MKEYKKNGKLLHRFHTDYVVCDTETTGKGYRYDRMTEIGLIRVRDHQIVDEYRTFINPHQKINPFVVKLTGIRDDMLVDAPDIDDVRDQIIDFIGDDIILGHNTTFDLNVLAGNLKMDIENDYMDTVWFARHADLPTPNNKLETLKEFFQIPNVSHRALDDCSTTKQVYDHLRGIMEKDPVEQGTVLKDFIQRMQDKGVVINYAQTIQNGTLIEEYCRLKKKTRLNTYSVSKTITSLAAGIALEENLFHLDDFILDYFDLNFEVDPYVSMITIEHLLTMTSGLNKALFFMDDSKRYTEKDWVRYFFNQKFPHIPGTHFQYSNFNTYILGCIIEKVSGMTLGQYVHDKLYQPLGINNIDWLSCPMGHTAAANSFFMTIDEMSKIGLLILNKGRWNNKQIVPEWYLDKAVKPYIQNYGYSFWIDEDYQCFRAEGNYGQFIIVVPSHQLVITMQSLDNKSLYKDIQKYLLKPIIKANQ